MTHFRTCPQSNIHFCLAYPILSSLLSCPFFPACPVLADYPNPRLYLLSGTRLWSTEHIGAAGRALQLRLLWRINRVSLSFGLSLSLSLTPSPAQAVNFY